MRESFNTGLGDVIDMTSSSSDGLGVAQICQTWPVPERWPLLTMEVSKGVTTSQCSKS